MSLHQYFVSVKNKVSLPGYNKKLSMSKYKPFDCQNSQTIIVKFHIKELGKTFLVEDEARENHIKSVVGGYVVLIFQNHFFCFADQKKKKSV